MARCAVFSAAPANRPPTIISTVGAPGTAACTPTPSRSAKYTFAFWLSPKRIVVALVVPTKLKLRCPHISLAVVATGVARVSGALDPTVTRMLSVPCGWKT